MIKRRTSHGPIAALTLALSVASFPADAALSRAELEELVTKSVDAAVLMSLVEKHCVDFDLDKRARRALEPRVDAAVLDAIVACRGAAGSPGSAASAAKAPAHRTTLAPRPASPPPPLPPGAQRFAVAPMVLDGVVDLEVTSLLLDRLRERVAPSQVIDPFTLGMHFGTAEGFNSGAPVEELVVAARAAGATDLLIAKATSYKQFQDFGVRIEADIVGVGDGEEAWSDRGRGVSANRSWSAAKRRAVIDLIRKVPIDEGG